MNTKFGRPEKKGKSSTGKKQSLPQPRSKEEEEKNTVGNGQMPDPEDLKDNEAN